MKSRSILYTKQMILAKLNGWKTVTRRPIKPQEQFPGKAFELYDYGPDHLLDILEKQHDIKCPFGRSGDQLWAKENYAILAYSDFEQAVQVKYKADGTIRWVQLHDEDWDKYKQWKQPTGSKSKLFLFKTLSRFWDEVMEITVERVQDITGEEAFNEGIRIARCGGQSYTDDYCSRIQYKYVFHKLWQTMYEGGPFDWNNNPWVFAVRNKPIIVDGQPAGQTVKVKSETAKVGQS